MGDGDCSSDQTCTNIPKFNIMATCGEERLNTARRHDKFVDKYLQTGDKSRNEQGGKAIGFNNPYLGLLLIPTSCRRPVGDGTYTDCTAGNYNLSNTKLAIKIQQQKYDGEKVLGIVEMADFDWSTVRPCTYYFATGDGTYAKIVHLKQTVVHRNGQNLIVNSMAHFDIINTRHPKRRRPK